MLHDTTIFFVVLTIHLTSYSKKIACHVFSWADFLVVKIQDTLKPQGEFSVICLEDL